jgi:hypothetical protein
MNALGTIKAMVYLWVACAACAFGGVVPVHRGLNRAIVFYDDAGHQMDLGGEAPDLVAFQSLKDAKAQEGLLGRETLFGGEFGVASVFKSSSSRPVAGIAPEMPAPSEGRRRQGDGGDRNWLVSSLTLPTLGQATSNAALAAISAQGKESGWGWLADEVASQGEAAGVPQEEEALPAFPGESGDREEAGRAPSDMPAVRWQDSMDGARADGAFPADGEEAQRREAAVTGEKSSPGGRLSDGIVPDDFSIARSSWNAAPELSGLPQTRALLSDSGGFAAPAGGFQSAGAEPPAERLALPTLSDRGWGIGSAGASGAGFSGTGNGLAGSYGAAGGASAVRAGMGERARWQGGWSGGGDVGLSPARYESVVEGLPSVSMPEAGRGAPEVERKPSNLLGIF